MWNSHSCNQSYDNFLRTKESKRHKDTLDGMTPVLRKDNFKVPSIYKSRSKKTRIQEESIKKIESSNQLLLKKMIEATPSPTTMPKQLPRCLSNFSLNYGSRLSFQNKVISENKKILERLKGTHSVYSTESWDSHYKRHKVIKESHSKSIYKSPNKHPELLANIPVCGPGVFENLKQKFYQLHD